MKQMTKVGRDNHRNTETQNKKNLIHFCASVILWSFSALIFSPICLSAADSKELSVTKVIVVGQRRIDTDALMQQVKSGPGKVDQRVVAEDIKRLYQTGFFEQVSASLVEEGKLQVLKFSLQEKPVVRKVFIKGNDDISKAQIEEILKFDGQKFLDAGQIDALIEAVKVLYQGEGFYDVQVTYSVVPVGDNQVDLTFSFVEGQKYKIREIKFVGLEKVDDSDLKDAMQTKRYKWWNSWIYGTGRLNKDMLSNDRNLMRQWFLDHGLIDAVIEEPVVEKRDNGIYISVKVHEGEEYQFGNVQASGDLFEGDIGKTIEGAKAKSGEMFNASLLREDTFSISEKYTDIGYAYTNVIPKTRVDPTSRSVDVDFEVNQGPKVSIDQIHIRGNDKTYDNVIRRELAISEQETFSSSKIKRSQELLRRRGYFEEVTIAPEEKKDGSKDKIDLGVNVREASTGTISAGAGYSSGDGALFNARTTENNLWGTGRSIDLEVDVGADRNNAVLTLEDPRVNDSLWSLSGNLLRTEREYSDFDKNQSGGGITAGYPLEEFFGESFEDVRFYTQYQYLVTDIHDVDPLEASQFVIDSEGTSTTSSVTPSVVRNKIDNPLNPTNGSKQTVSVELAGIGGDEEFYQLELKNQWYEPILDSGIGQFIFSWRTNFGYGESFNGEDFPLSQRYFPGGINSVRGYKNRTLGPKDERGNEYGGSKQFINNFELIFPLFEQAGLKGVIFYDMGQAFDDDENIDLGDLRKAWGYGFRWNSPLGPIRVEIGFPIDKEEGEDGTVTLFSFGAPL